MKTFTLYRALLYSCVTSAITLLSVITSQAQVVRSYGDPTFSDNLRGGHTIFGNTLLRTIEADMNYVQVGTAGNNFMTSIYGNDNSPMQWVDIDGSAATFNSSAADLVLPTVPGTFTVKFARLYWGGRVINSTIAANDANLRTVKIRKGTSGAYTTLTAPVAQIDKSAVGSAGPAATAYQSYIDVTDFVNTNGGGTYTVADVICSEGTIDGGGYYGGWSMAIVYENTNMAFSSVRVYDGFLQVFNGGSPTTQSIQLTGLNAPGTPVLATDAYMSIMAWEGDANDAASATNAPGDFIKVNGFIVSNAINPAVNFWNGTVSKNGSHVTSKFPDYRNQMSIDVDELEVGTGYGIAPNSTTVSIEFGTEADQYFPSIFAFTMKTKEPLVSLDKTGTSSILPALLLNANETLTYTLSGINNGGGNALNTVVTDTIPFGLTYVPGSLIINSSPGGIAGPKTDAAGDDQAYIGTNGSKTFVQYFLGTGAVSGTGGIISASETYSVQFKCTAPANANLTTSVTNTARITGTGVDGSPFVDDGTFIFGAGGSTLPVRLTDFTAAKDNANALLKWTTTGELKNDRFEIETSKDGVSFEKTGIIAGNGTTSDTKNYQYREVIPANTTMVYYRLRIIDEDGGVTFSKIVALKLNGSASLNNFSVYPNPFTTNVKMQISSVKESNVNVRISNASGVQVVNRSVLLQPGDNIIILQDLAALQAGLYVMEIITEEGKVAQKIMKK
jgi:uncharacterized repeat protein (TIGR01451 family)